MYPTDNWNYYYDEMCPVHENLTKGYSALEEAFGDFFW